MNNRILITYATRAGSTVEVAAAIGESLAQCGFAVDVIPVKENPNLADYQAVILGSAIRMGNWLPEVVEFVKKNQAHLSQMPTAFFTCHRLNTGDDETSRKAREAYTTLVRQIVTPQAEIFFSGELNHSKLSFVDRTLAKAIEKSTNTPEGDFRDLDKIHGWAQSIFA